LASGLPGDCAMRELALRIIGISWLGLVIAVNPSLASSVNGYQVVSQMQAQADMAKSRIIKERDREIEARKGTAQDKIQAVNESAELEIAKVPRYIYNTPWGYPVLNTDYDRTVAYIRVDAQKQINAINRDLATITKTVNATYQAKLDAIDESTANVGSQIRPGTSDVQLMPLGSSIYVKNYVNYSVSNASGTKSIAEPVPMVGLKARQKSLACKTKNKFLPKI
jgi:hypothetical protein